MGTFIYYVTYVGWQLCNTNWNAIG